MGGAPGSEITAGMGGVETPEMPPEGGAPGEEGGVPGEEGGEMPPPSSEAERMKRESVEYSRRLGMLLTSKKK